MSAIPFGGRFAVSEYVRTATQTPSQVLRCKGTLFFWNVQIITYFFADWMESAGGE